MLEFQEVGGDREATESERAELWGPQSASPIWLLPEIINWRYSLRRAFQ